MNLLRVAFVLFLLQAGTPPVAPRGSIEGVVLRAGSSEPLPHTQVKLFKALTREEMLEAYRGDENPDSNSPTVYTDAEGKFIFNDVAAGPYRVVAYCNGYVQQAFGQKVIDGPGATIPVQAGQAVKNIVVRLIQGAVVVGRVRNTDGEPIPRLQVSLMRIRYNENGGRSIAEDDQAQTDDRGEYRLFWVNPGRYYLMVSRLPEGYDRKNVVDEQPIPATFYPGVLVPESATVLELQAGTEVGPIDVVVPKPSGSRIRGRVVDPLTGKPPKNTSIRLKPRKTSAIQVSDYYGASAQARYDASSGTFDIRNVVPGSYWVSASSQAGYNEPLSADKLADVKTREDLFSVAFGGSGAGGQVSVDVGAEDINDLLITVTKGVSFPVQIRIEDAQFSAVKGADEIRVTLAANDGRDAYRQSSRANADGGAKLTDVQTGEYLFYVGTGTLKNVYPKEMMFGRNDVRFEPALITDQTTVTLNVVLGKSGEIEGTLTDPSGQPANGDDVVLIPDLRDRKRLFQTVAADHSGHFVFSGVPPGNYKLFSWEALERNAYYDPDVLERYEGHGEPVTIQESLKHKVDVKMIPAPKQ